MKTPSKDLFDDSTMTFGEHLEVLRTHLIRAIFGLIITVVICLYKGDVIVDFIRQPIDRALRQYSEIEVEDDTQAMKSGWEKFQSEMGLDTLNEILFGATSKEEPEKKTDVSEGATPKSDAITVQMSAKQLADALHELDPDRFAAPKESPVPSPASEDENATNEPQSPANKAGKTPPKTLSIELRAPEFAQFQRTVEQSRRAVTLNVQEAFMTYLKVSLIAAVVLASPWIFFQLWQFVAAGLYPHERKYVYVYGTMSLFLFLLGAVFCFYLVFPFVLKFLLGFNSSLEIHPQIRLSEWISFAVVLPLMFGISFQLPLVMLFLERISIFGVDQYRHQRRMAILVIAILSSILTPADPMSMLLMMFPLIFLYELGIKLCLWLPRARPFDAEPAI